uniref:Uncharacterized protein n=1 Tax=Anguilla anguilla TaxID=7936 RepID=A0A0E9WH38_ANGAN
MHSHMDPAKNLEVGLICYSLLDELLSRVLTLPI